MPDCLKNLYTGETLTSDIISTSRTPSLNQILNQALDGTVYVQNIGKIQYSISVRCLMHEDNDSVLYSTYENGEAVQVSDDDRVYVGFITRVVPSSDYAEGYYECVVTIQEEVVS